jgi:hypothetical protein
VTGDDENNVQLSSHPSHDKKLSIGGKMLDQSLSMKKISEQSFQNAYEDNPPSKKKGR